MDNAQVETLNARIRVAERKMADMFAAQIWGNHYTDGETRRPITPPSWTVHLGYHWYAVREWIAVHVLRVQVDDGEGD